MPQKKRRKTTTLSTPEHTINFVSGGDNTHNFHKAVLRTDAGWRDWQPDDPCALPTVFEP